MQQRLLTRFIRQQTAIWSNRQFCCSGVLVATTRILALVTAEAVVVLGLLRRAQGRSDVVRYDQLGAEAADRSFVFDKFAAMRTASPAMGARWHGNQDQDREQGRNQQRQDEPSVRLATASSSSNADGG